MTKTKLPKLLLTTLATASLTFGIISCGDDDKKENPQPDKTNNSQAPACIKLDETTINKLTGKKWYQINTNGTSWIQFNKADTSWVSQNLDYSKLDTQGKWDFDGDDCTANMRSRKYDANGVSYTEQQKPIKITAISDSELQIAEVFNNSATKNFKTTP